MSAINTMMVPPDSAYPFPPDPDDDPGEDWWGFFQAMLYVFALAIVIIALCGIVAVCRGAEPAAAQWGGRGCGPSGPVGPPVEFYQPQQIQPQHSLPLTNNTPQWAAFSGEPRRYGLYRGNLQIGHLNAEGNYRPLLIDGAWGDFCEPPIARPVNAKRPIPQPLIGQDDDQKSADDIPPDGVDPAKIRTHLYTINGQPISEAEAKRRVKQHDIGQLKDDSALPRLTIVGPEADRKAFLSRSDVTPSLQYVLLTGRSVGTPGFDPGDFRVNDRGLVSGKAYLTKANAGQPNKGLLIASGDITGGNNAALIEALKALDPSYKPTPVRPGPNGPNNTPQIDLATVAKYGPFGIALIALVTLFWKRKT